MATQERKNNKRKSGFSGDPIGIVHAKGSTIKKNPDGTVTIVPPKKKKK